METIDQTLFLPTMYEIQFSSLNDTEASVFGFYPLRSTTATYWGFFKLLQIKTILEELFEKRWISYICISLEVDDVLKMDLSLVGIYNSRNDSQK